MNKIDLENQRQFLMGYNDAKSLKTINYEGRSIHYINGARAYFNSVTKSINDFQRGYEDAREGKTVYLDGESTSYVQGYIAYQNELIESLNDSPINSIKL